MWSLSTPGKSPSNQQIINDYEKYYDELTVHVSNKQNFLHFGEFFFLNIHFSKYKQKPELD